MALEKYAVHVLQEANGTAKDAHLLQALCGVLGCTGHASDASWILMDPFMISADTCSILLPSENTVPNQTPCTNPQAS